MSNIPNITANNLSVSGNTTMSGTLTSTSNASFNNVTSTISNNGINNCTTLNCTSSNISNMTLSNVLNLLAQSPIKFTYNGQQYTISTLMLYSLFSLGGGNLATQTYVQQQIANLVSSSPTLLQSLQSIANAIASDPQFQNSITAMIARCAQLSGNNTFSGENTFSGAVNHFINNVQIDGTVNGYDIDNEFRNLESDVTNLNSAVTLINTNLNTINSNNTNLQNQINGKAGTSNPLIQNLYINNSSGVLPTINNGFGVLCGNMTNGQGELSLINNFTSVNTNSAPAFRFSKMSNSTTNNQLMQINNNGDISVTGNVTTPDVYVSGTSQKSTNNALQSQINSLQQINTAYNMDATNKNVTGNTITANTKVITPDVTLNNVSLNTTLSNQSTLNGSLQTQITNNNNTLQNQINSNTNTFSSYNMDSTNKNMTANVITANTSIISPTITSLQNQINTLNGLTIATGSNNGWYKIFSLTSFNNYEFPSFKITFVNRSGELNIYGSVSYTGSTTTMGVISCHEISPSTTFIYGDSKIGYVITSNTQIDFYINFWQYVEGNVYFNVSKSSGTLYNTFIGTTQPANITFINNNVYKNINETINGTLTTTTSITSPTIICNSIKLPSTYYEKPQEDCIGRTDETIIFSSFKSSSPAVCNIGSAGTYLVIAQINDINLDNPAGVSFYLQLYNSNESTVYKNGFEWNGAGLNQVQVTGIFQFTGLANSIYLKANRTFVSCGGGKITVTRIA